MWDFSVKHQVPSFAGDPKTQRRDLVVMLQMIGLEGPEILKHGHPMVQIVVRQIVEGVTERGASQHDPSKPRTDDGAECKVDQNHDDCCRNWGKHEAHVVHRKQVMAAMNEKVESAVEIRGGGKRKT